jgi:thiopurine S-methyltransferase
MHAEFWLERWQQNQIGFHCEEINPYLQRYLPYFDLEKSSRIFVPLCGKSNDMLWLLAQGYDVVSVELSPLAIAAFFSENALSATISTQGEFTVNQVDGLSIYCGDFFHLTTNDLAGVSAVYDRAALVALPLEMRTAYIEQMKYLLESGTKILLVVFDYLQQEMQGPPFSVSVAEVEALYSDWCELTLLCTQGILDREPHFRSRGLTQLREHVYVLTVK